MTEYINIVREGSLSVCVSVCMCVCVYVCVSVCLSVEALAPKRLDGFKRNLGFEVGQEFASGVFFIF